jgi:hypothetical protein
MEERIGECEGTGIERRRRGREGVGEERRKGTQKKRKEKKRRVRKESSSRIIFSHLRLSKLSS